VKGSYPEHFAHHEGPEKRGGGNLRGGSSIAGIVQVARQAQTLPDIPKEPKRTRPLPHNLLSFLLLPLLSTLLLLQRE
jgi:hypothetical protein